MRFSCNIYQSFSCKTNNIFSEIRCDYDKRMRECEVYKLHKN